MAVGGCFCGKIRIEYNGQPLTTALCHCDDCRKLTGSPYTYNFVVKGADLVITGSPKEVPKTADSGNQIRNYFCPDCGIVTATVLYKETASDERVRHTAVWVESHFKH